MELPDASKSDRSFRAAVRFVVCANLAYFCVEFVVARRIGSVSLFADSIDFLEDAALNTLVLLGIGRSLRTRARVGRILALLILLPGIAVLWTAWNKFTTPEVPEPLFLSATGVGALLVNFTCAATLAHFRHHIGSLTRAAFLSARNDVLANLAIILAAVVTLIWPSRWPDLLVGLAIAAMNADAATKVWHAARRESESAHHGSESTL